MTLWRPMRHAKASPNQCAPTYHISAILRFYFKLNQYQDFLFLVRSFPTAYSVVMLPMSPDMSLLDRMVLGVERVRDRLLRASAALEAAKVPYAVAGGNAVAAWVATVDAAAVRNTQDVDILLRRSDLGTAAKALQGVGFLRRHVAGMEVFLDGPDAKVRDAVHVLMAREKVRPEYQDAAPDVSEAEKPGGAGGFSVVKLEALVRMKLTSFRDKDRTHLRDMLEIGLIDASWTTRFGAELGARLQRLIDTPEQ
jgi:hypothetical protein